MNLILVDSLALKQKLEKTDRRAVKIAKILGKSGSGVLYVGYPDGVLGKAKTAVRDSGEVELEVEWFPDCSDGSSKSGISVLFPFCRPQTCRKVLREAASIGIGKLVMFQADKADPGYAESSLWKTDEWKKLLLEGVEQAFNTQVPELVFASGDLLSALSLDCDEALITEKIALDNYESTVALGEVHFGREKCLLAFGPERGWSDRERDVFRDQGFTLSNMGSRVMRIETAVVAACSVVSSLSGKWGHDTRMQLGKMEGC